MEEKINFRMVNPQSYPKELRQIIYYAKDCLKLKRQIEEELEHARTYRKKALKTILLEANLILEMAENAIKGEKVDEDKMRIGVKIISAVCDGNLRRVEKKEEN